MKDGPATAIILAAGGSARLGQPKQLLMRNGETLVHRTARLASEAGASPVILVVGAHAEAVTDACADLRPQVVSNPDWKTGLASSLGCATRCIPRTDGPVLILVCDQPALEPAHLQALLKGALSSATGCAATRHADRLGIPVVVPARLLHLASAHGDRGLGDMLSGLTRDAVAVLDAPELQFDIDTQEDVRIGIERTLLDPAARPSF